MSNKEMRISHLFLLFVSIIAGKLSVADNQYFPKFPDKPVLTVVSDFSNKSMFLPTTPVILQCTASYPVYFDFIPPKFSAYKTLSTLHSSYYNETLLIWYPGTSSQGINFSRSGNYTCRSGLDGNVASSVYMHVTESKALFDGSRVPSYSKSLQDKYWIIPCPANVARFDKIRLFTEIHKNILPNAGNITFKTPIYQDTNITNYDPQYGFLLEKSLHSRPEGKFKCSGNVGDNTDYITITLKTFKAVPAGDKVIYENNNTFQVTCEADEEIRFEFSRNTTFKNIIRIPSSSKSFKYSLVYVIEENANLTGVERVKISPYSTDYLTSGKVSCVTVNGSKVLHVWEHDISKLCTCKRGPSPASEDEIKKIITGEGYSYSDIKPGFPFCKVNDDYNTSPTVGYIETDTKFKTFMAQKYFSNLSPSEQINSIHSSYRYRTRDAPYTSSLISCTPTGGYTTLIKAVATASGYYFNSDSFEDEPSNLIKMYIKKYDKDNYIYGDLVDITCVASRYSFYNGSMLWTLNYENGTQISLPQAAGKDVRRENGAYTDTPLNIARNASPFGIPAQWSISEKLRIRLTENLQSVSCSATKWNSTSVVTTNYTLDSYQNIDGSLGYFDGNEKLRCNKASPHPTIVMTRINYSYGSDMLARLAQHIVNGLNVTVPYGYTINLHCLAEYPMEWTFQGDDVISTVIRIDSVNKDEPTQPRDNYYPCFDNVISVSTTYFSSTGKYTCRKKNDYHKSTSVYIYTNPTQNSTARLINAGSHLYVTLDKTQQATVLPCRVSNSEATVDLYYHETHGSYRKLGPSEIISYDPRIGFSMDTNQLTSSAVYICSMKNDISPLTSVTISIQGFQLKSNTTDSLMMNKMLSRVDQLLLEFKNSSNPIDIIQLIVLFIIIGLLGSIFWFFLQQRKHKGDTERKLGAYIQLDETL